MKRAAMLPLLVFALSCGGSDPKPVTPTPTTAAELQVGQPSPDFAVKSSAGEALSLAGLKGKWVVVYFYPKDETPGCTKEACGFRDAFKEISQKAVIVGVSADDDDSHKKFIEHWQLPFHLVSDPKGELGKKFGVPFGEKYPGMHSRQTIVIGPDGSVKKIYRTVDVTKHPTEILVDVST
jgi:thioredoxin-dependent peroxiredoxin